MTSKAKILLTAVIFGLMAFLIDYLVFRFEDYIPLSDRFLRIGCAITYFFVFSAAGYVVALREDKSARYKQDLMHSEQRYRLLFQNCADALLVCPHIAGGPPKKFIDCNQKALDLFGYTREEMLCQTAMTITSDDSLSEIQGMGEEIDDSGYSFRELKALKKDGTISPVEVILHSIDVGSEFLVVSSIRDISDQRASELAKIETEKKYRDMMDSLPVSVFEMDFEGNLLYVNPEGLRKFGITGNELGEGLNGFDFIDPKDEKKILSQLVNISAGNPVADEYELTNRKGVRFPSIIHTVPLVENGSAYGLRGVIVDLTPVREARNALIEALQRFETMISQTPDIAVQGFDRNGIIRIWNTASENLYGYKYVDVLGKNIHEIGLRTSETESPKNTLAKIVESGTAAPPGEWEIVTATGEKRWVYSTMFPILLDGEVDEIIRMDVDITDRKNMDDELRIKNIQLQAAIDIKNKFVSMVSHELRTPMVPIIGYTELLLNDTFGVLPGKMIDPIKTIHSKAESLSTLIEDLLTLSRIDEGRLNYTIRDYDLSDLVDSVIKPYLEVDRGKEIRVHISGEQVMVSTDQIRFKQILNNIISNAVKYSGESLELRISMGERDNTGFVSVEDNGIGIDEAHVPHIFDRFYQAEDVNTRSHDGVGLGLAISNDIINSMNGCIEVSSKPNVGSTFTILLPLAAGDISSIKNSNGDLDMQDLRKFADEISRIEKERFEILVVDDDSFTRELLTAVLKEYYNITTASNGKEALSLLSSHDFDLILLDWMMPDLDGISILKAIRKEPVTSAVPVIFISGRIDNDSISRGLIEGANEFISKPFRKSELMEKVKACINSRISAEQTN
jgi:PAS domain S-box-containing protein